MPCRTRFSTRMIWRKGWTKSGRLAEWMLRKNRWSSGSHHIKPPPSPNGYSSNNLSSNHPCCQMASAAFKYIPQTAAKTFAFSSVWFVLYATELQCTLHTVVHFIYLFILEPVPDWVVGLPPGTVEVGPVLRDAAKLLHRQRGIWNRTRKKQWNLKG